MHFDTLPVDVLPLIASFIPELKAFVIFIDELAFQSTWHVTAIINKDSAKTLFLPTICALGGLTKNDVESSDPLEVFKSFIHVKIGMLKLKSTNSNQRAKWTTKKIICPRCLHNIQKNPIPLTWQQFYYCEEYCKKCYMTLAETYYGKKCFYMTGEMRKQLGIPRSFPMPHNSSIAKKGAGEIYFLPQVEDYMKHERSIRKQIKRKNNSQGSILRNKRRKTSDATTDSVVFMITSDSD
jgi:hypothetical protein